VFCSSPPVSGVGGVGSAGASARLFPTLRLPDKAHSITQLCLSSHSHSSSSATIRTLLAASPSPALGQSGAKRHDWLSIKNFIWYTPGRRERVFDLHTVQVPACSGSSECPCVQLSKLRATSPKTRGFGQSMVRAEATGGTFTCAYLPMTLTVSAMPVHVTCTERTLCASDISSAVWKCASSRCAEAL